MSAAEGTPTSDERRLVLIAVGVVGASAVMTQLTLLREFLVAFAGNELVLGLALGLWLLLTGAGTWIGRLFRARPAPAFTAGLLLLAVIPPVQLLAIRGLRGLVFPHGAIPGLAGTTLGCAVVLLPFCLVSGALLTVACRLVGRARDSSAVGRVYAADATGSIVGGAAFCFVLVGRFDPFVLLSFPAFAALGVSIALAMHFRRTVILGLAGLALGALAVTLASGDPDARSEQWRHRGAVVDRTVSPYGRIVVTNDAGQLTFFESGTPVVTSPDVAAAEEAAHYAMAQRPGAREVLVIGGAVSGVAREVLRHPVAAVTAVELDPGFLAAGRRLVPENFSDPRLTTVTDDGRRYIRRKTARFDVIILALPDPSTLQLNRFFTAEFFAAARRALAPGGVIAFGLARYENYVGPDLARVLASAHRTLSTAFAHVMMIPGGRVYFLGSDEPLHRDIAAQLEPGGLSLQRVNRHYLDAMLAPDRLADLDRAVAEAAEPNTDFRPVLFHYHLRHWLSQFAVPGAMAVALLAIVAAAGLAGPGPAPRVIFAAGFSGTALPIVLLLAFQVFHGSLYRQLGLVVTLFMAGLAAGAGWVNRRPDSVRPLRTLAHLGIAIALLALALPWLLVGIGGMEAAGGSDATVQAVLPGLAFCLAVLIGAQFPLAGRALSGLDSEHIAARLFVADLAGAALGALLISTWLLPRVGLTAVCLITAGLNAATAALAWRASRTP